MAAADRATLLVVGDRVSKNVEQGRTPFRGTVVCVFRTLGGKLRLVVEGTRGQIHVYSDGELTKEES